MIFFQKFIDFLFYIRYDVLKGGTHMGIRYDFHLHSDFSGDSDTSAQLMAERALALGLDGLCFTEHHDPDYPPVEECFELDFDAYFPSLAKLKEQYRDRLWIGTGMEFGIQKHLAPQLMRLADTYPFDFIIASCHLLYGEDPYYGGCFAGRKEEDCYADFFREQYEGLKQMAPESFDTLGHLDFIVRYGPNRNLFYSYEKYADVIDPVLRFLIDNGKCLEINTGGLKYGLGEPNPCTDVLRRYKELGGELITIGSDAHAPQHLCFDFKKAHEILSTLGFCSYTIFKQRRPQQILL